MNGILEEATAEAVGASSKRWALLLIAFVIGGAVALWLVKRSRGELDLAGEAVEPAAGGAAAPV